MKIQSTSVTTNEQTPIFTLGSRVDDELILKITLRDHSNHELEPYMRIIYFSESAYLDYYTYRTLYLTENNLFLVSKLVKTAADGIEKLLKLFLLSYDPHMESKKFSHNLNKLREACEEIDAYYQNPILKLFCDEYSQKMQSVNGHQIFGYSDNSVIDNWQADCSKILDLLDETYLETLIRMNGNISYSFSDFFAIYLNRKTAISKHQPKFNDVKNILFSQNKYVDDFYNKYKEIIIANTIPV